MSSDACGYRRASGANARMRWGTCRRLKMEPTYSAFAPPDAAAAEERGGVMPGGITWMLDSDTPKRSTISRRENCEIVMTERAQKAAWRDSQRRLMPSRDPNHSGCAWNERSWMATTTGTRLNSGAE